MDVKNVLICAQNPDDNVRKWAEFYLGESEKKNIEEFFVNLSNILSGENNEPEIRRLAGLILKNRLEAKEMDENSFLFYKWFSSVKKLVRENIKTLILSVFKSPSKIARRTASQVLAKITSIELVNGESNNILEISPKLLENNKQDTNFYHAIIETVEFICQETGSDKFPDQIFKKCSLQITKIFLQAINETNHVPSDIKIAALNGLLSSIEFLEDILKEQSYRDFIIRSVCDQIKNTDISIRALSFETLDKMAQNYYYLLEEYVSILFELTIETISNDNDLVVLQVIEFWSTIADEEFQLNMDVYQALNEGRFISFYSRNYISKTSSYLPDLLLNCIKTKNETERVDEWNCCSAAGACLNIMSQASPREVIYPVIFFIDKNISNKILNIDIECITLAFIAIFDGIGSKVLYGYVRKMVEFWLIYFEKSTNSVRYIINLTVGKISHYFPCMIRHFLDRILQTILCNYINKPIVHNPYWCLNEMLQSFSREGILDWCFEYTISIIINKILSKSQDNNITNELLELFSSLIINSSIRSRPFIFVVLPFFLSNFNTSVIKKENIFLTDNNEAQKYLCRILGYFMQKYGEKVNPLLIEKMIRLLSQIIFEQGDNITNCSLEEEILACIGAIVQLHRNEFSLKVKEWVNFLLKCIDNIENVQNCSLAVGVIGDICRTVENEIKPYIDKIIDSLISNLRKNNLDGRLKPSLITCLGDIMLIYGFKSKHFNNLIDLFKKTVITSKEPNFDKNIEILEINFKINESILECISGIIQGCQDQKNVSLIDKFYEKLKWIINHIYNTISSDRMFKIVKICIGLIGDLSLSFDSIKKVFQKEVWVYQLLHECKNNRESKLKNLGSWTFESVFY
nr:importin beta-1 SU [Cryptomonas sp.]